jgi:hypothetical protein
VLRDGEPFRDFDQKGSTLAIRTDVEREHVFEVKMDERAASSGKP